jgi:hypothetical protein
VGVERDLPQLLRRRNKDVRGEREEQHGVLFFYGKRSKTKTVIALFALEPGVNQHEIIQNASTTALGRLRNADERKTKRWERSMGLNGVPKYDDLPSEKTARVHRSP